MYARFLGEAASITGAKAENPADLLETATEPMHGIADREQDFWERLDAMIAA
jgi:hypothetical protein